MPTNRTTSTTPRALEDGQGSTPVPSGPVAAPTVTHHQKIASEFSTALDGIAGTIPTVDLSQISTADLVRAHQGIPMQFLDTVISAVEQLPELQATRKLDPAAARDTMQFLEANRSVLDKTTAFQKQLKGTMRGRKSLLVLACLQMYAIAQGFARDSAVVAAHVANMKRDLGRRGPKTSLALRRARRSPGLGVPPRLLPGNEQEGWPRDDAEPRG